MDVNSKIQQIIVNRSSVANSVNELLKKWNERLVQANELMSNVNEIKNVCSKAITEAPLQDQQYFQELYEYLDSLDKQQALQGNIGQATYAISKLSKLSERFGRKTINIAVAGVGRCGKSTALKAIIGQQQNDNSTIPSGNGTAVTAGKSTITCVATEAEEKTVVCYHSVSSFLEKVINPLLEDLGLGSKRCTSQYDFEHLNFNELKRIFDENQQAADKAVQDAEKDNAIGTAASEQKLAQAKAYAASFNQKIERLSHLEDIIKSFPSFFNRLTGSAENIPLKQTYKYISYPKNDEPAICYAVKECTIYSRFPNNTIQSLQLVDLPGLGTGSLSERKCFMEGFNYSIDLALMIRRPEGLFQNFTTDDDINVIEVIGATFGQDHLHECTLLFQNDANLPQSDTEAAYKKIEKWNLGRKHPLTVIRGNAFDSSEMQNKILPFVLQFMLDNLPLFDKDLLDESLPELETMATKFDTLQEDISNKLQNLKRNFRSGDGSANEVADLAEQLRDNIMNGLNDIIDYYKNEFDLQNALLPEKIDELTKILRGWAENSYNHNDANQMKRVRDEIRRAQSPVPYANGEIHAIRIHISEVYSEMEKIHAQLIEEMQKRIASIFAQNFASLVETDASLADFANMFEESRDCPETVDALNSVLSLEVPFYNTVYPDLRNAVFDDVNNVQQNFNLDNSLSDEKRAAITLGELQNTAYNWIYKSENVLQTQSRIKEIILATLERLQDRLCRNRSTKRELIDFVQHFWSKIQGDDKSFSQDVHAKLEKISK